jgi:tetratricopeptide (TPR) repeat protein
LPGAAGRWVRGRASVVLALLAFSIALVLSVPGVAAQTDPNPEASTVREPHALGAAGSRVAMQQRPLRDATPPADRNDLSAWLTYKTSSQRPALPQEARLFYRRGLMAWQSGNRDAAVQLVRGAAELDPTFADPHTTLVSWFMFRDPGQALLEAAALFQFARECFAFQLSLVANGLYLLLQSLFLGLLAAGLLVVGLRNAELRHGWQERLSGFLTPRAARKWPWVFLAVPFLIGLGLAWPTVVLLALLWPSLKVRERALFIVLLAALVSAPWIGSQMSRLAGPLRQDGEPFYGMFALQSQPHSPEEKQRLEYLAGQHPDSPFVQFGLAWSARQNGDYAEAEATYRRTLELWPGNDRALSNLGNVLSLQGRYDEAIEVYGKAIEVNPSNAAAYFNLAQAHTQRYDYRAASEALSHASALNFDMLRSRQGQTMEDGQLPLVDQWIAPRFFWQALLRHRAPAGEALLLPTAWRNRIEVSGWGFSIAALLSVLLALGLGIASDRSMPLRHCSNCDRVVCRRCAERRRELALCHSCATVEARAEAADFARVLLQEHRRKTQHAGRLVRTALATLIPGYGLLALRSVFTPVLLLTIAAGLGSAWLKATAPFSYEPRFDAPIRETSLLVPIATWALIYAVSILGYFVLLGRHQARVAATLRAIRPRSGPASRRATSAAA